MSTYLWICIFFVYYLVCLNHINNRQGCTKYVKYCKEISYFAMRFLTEQNFYLLCNTYTNT